jgi:CRISPR/Cas system type I-B associated protein Csh2 (Cas7 group RAMP superfamily)
MKKKWVWKLSDVVGGRICFTILISVKNSNLNGDPDNANESRRNSRGYALVSPGCILAMIRNAMQVLKCGNVYMTPASGTFFETNAEVYKALNLEIKSKDKFDSDVVPVVQAAIC